jgi:hypothetical protein
MIALYEKHTQVLSDEVMRGRFARRLWCLLARYDTIGNTTYVTDDKAMCSVLMR